MSHRYRQHPQRQVTDLNGLWDFTFLGEVEPQSVELDTLTFPDRMAVPGCFDATPAYAGQRGLAAYRTRIRLSNRSPHRLFFEAANQACWVYLDRQLVGGHAGGFTPFSVDIPSQDPGPAELVVLVDNRLDQPGCPLHRSYFDWYQYGGLIRGVELHCLGTTWIDSLVVVTEALDPPTLKVTLGYAAVGSPGLTRFSIDCDHQRVVEELVDLATPSGQIVQRVELPGASLWSPGSPNLHWLHVRLGQDDWVARTGIRQVRVAQRQILVNDQPVRLLGFNRHESHPQFGHSQPDALLVADIQQLRDLGANFVRGSHYPQDPRFLDLCDEAGICVWSEAIGWQPTSEHLTDRFFVDAQRAHIGEMVAAACNHPCVILWGLLNEGASHDRHCQPAYRELIALLRELDPTRPVTYASCHPFDDLCFDLVDVVSVNLYPGWYIGSQAETPSLLDGVLEHLDQGVAAKRPVIISEIGAGALPGWRDAHNDRWSEGYQANLLETVIRHLFIDRQRVCGLSIWLFNDFRSLPSLGRPRGYNNKGVVDEYRRPKLAYQTVKGLFHQLA